MSHRNTHDTFRTNDRARARLLGVPVAGEHQYAVAYMFLKTNMGEWPPPDTRRPRVGELHLGPHHMMDALIHDHALLPDEVTQDHPPMGVCRVVDTLPACERCGVEAWYEVSAPFAEPAASWCERCSTILTGLELGYQTATFLLTWDEVPATIRETCNALTDELERSRLGS